MAVQQNMAAFIMEEKGRLQVGPAEIYVPEENEVLVRVLAAAISPLDAAVAKHAKFFKMSYPTILGSQVAGVVEAIGKAVTKVQVGDKIVAGTDTYPSKGNQRYGAMQRFTIVNEFEVIEIGDTDPAEAVASGYQAAAGAVFAKSGLGLDPPTNPGYPVRNGKKVLIWGGSCAFGAICIAHAKAAGYTVISTSSPHNFSILKARGADHVFDRNDPATPGKIQAQFPIDHFLDVASTTESIRSMIAVLTIPGNELVQAEIITSQPASMIPDMPELPKGITTRFSLFRNKAPENADLIDFLLKRGGYLEKGLKDGWIRGVPPEKIGGLSAWPAGIERRDQGVSGVRLVVEPWKE